MDAREPFSRGDRALITSFHVRRAVVGDRESLEWIFARFLPLIRRQAAWRLGKAHGEDAEVDDLVSEAWLVALPRLPDIRPRAGRFTPVFLTFLSTVIRQIANDRLRRQIRRRVLSLDDGGSGGMDAALAIRTTISNLSRSEVTQEIQRCLDRLDERERLTVILRGVEGQTNQEVAEELGELPNTVSKRYQRALEKLRRFLPSSVFDELEL